MHSAVFEDMVENGTPKAQLPFCEQRVGARYAEYHAGAADSDTSLGEATVQYLTGKAKPEAPFTLAIAGRTVEVAGPLRDYLEDIDLIP